MTLLGHDLEMCNNLSPMTVYHVATLGRNEVDLHEEFGPR